MPRLTRSKQQSSKATSQENAENVSSDEKPNARVKGQKSRSAKGNNKSSNINMLSASQSLVLRDRTNMTMAPTIVDLLKKGVQDKAATGNMKVEELKKPTASKVPKSQNLENVRIPLRRLKVKTEENKNVKSVKSTNTVVSSTSSTDSGVIVTEDEQDVHIKRSVRKKASNNEVADVKSKKKEVPKVIPENSRQTRAMKTISQHNQPKSPPAKAPKPVETVKKSITRATRTSVSSRPISQVSAKKNTDKSIAGSNDKKFFKSKGLKPATDSKKIPAPKKNNGRVVASKANKSFRLRQTTLKESFVMQEKKALRPRKTKNYNENSKVVPEKPDSGVELEKNSAKKGPIYKTQIKPQDSPNDKDKVYDFMFDQNDSTERASKKRKKKVTRRAPAKKQKIARIKTEQVKKPVNVPKVTTKITSVDPIVTNVEQVEEPVIPPEVTTKISDVDLIMANIEITSVAITGNKNTNKSDLVTVKPPQASPTNNNKPITVTAEVYEPPASPPARPRVVSNEILDDTHRISLTVTPKSDTEEFRPFRKTNAFSMRPSMQFKTMMNATLIRESLSPITKEAIEDFDIGSPWRPTLPATFSRVKNVFQSTPQGKKFSTLMDKASMATNDKARFTTIEEKNENINKSIVKSAEKPFIAKSPLKSLSNSKSPRKFGTEISNFNNNNDQKSPSKSPKNFGISNLSPSKTSIVKLQTVNKRQALVTAESINEDLPDFDEITEEKENSAPNYQSPMKSPSKKTTPDSRLTKPLTISDTIKAKELFAPQPGTSGVQKRTPLTDMWSLKQSNLNKFLDLPEMPESTRITTNDGIFDDVNSTPINGKSVKPTPTELNIDNAFGFDDDNSDSSASPIKKTVAIEKVQVQPKPTVEEELKPARLSEDEVKKLIIQNAAKKNKHDVAEYEKPKKSPVKERENNPVNANTQADNFLDTFDNIHDNDDNFHHTNEDIPLFADLEPVHFNQPPRYSYKRKRHDSLSTSGEPDEEVTVDQKKRLPKKKKMGKVQREQKKKVDEWVKNLNKTFEEVEDFDLVVEPVRGKGK